MSNPTMTPQQLAEIQASIRQIEANIADWQACGDTEMVDTLQSVLRDANLILLQHSAGYSQTSLPMIDEATCHQTGGCEV